MRLMEIHFHFFYLFHEDLLEFSLAMQKEGGSKIPLSFHMSKTTSDFLLTILIKHSETSIT